MPYYVPDPDNPGKHVDVVVLQARYPLRVLPAFLLSEWMRHDTWSRREALMLLAGYNPNVTQWTEVADGFSQFHAGNRGYLDGMSDRMIQHANVHWQHPRHDEAYEQFLSLSDYARGGSLDERMAPSKWIAWAASKGFTPYWNEQINSLDPSSSVGMTESKGNFVQHGLDSPGRTQVIETAQRKKRRDAIAIVIDDVVAQLKSDATRVTTAVVWDALYKLARSDDRIDIATDGSGITWTRANRDQATLTQSMLDDRLRNAGHI